MKITPNTDRLLVTIPKPDEKVGMLFVPDRAKVEPKVVEAIVLEAGPEAKLYKAGQHVLIPTRILGDRLADGTVFVHEKEVFALVEDTKIEVVPAGAVLLK